MRTVILAAAMLPSVSALANPSEDYTACLIGYSVVALEQQGHAKDPLAAFGVAQSRCPEPVGLDPEDEGREATFYLIEEIAEKVMVERMAAE